MLRQGDFLDHMAADAAVSGTFTKCGIYAKCRDVPERGTGLSFANIMVEAVSPT